MKIASVAEIKSKLSEYIKESRKGAVVITRNGKPVARLVPASGDRARLDVRSVIEELKLFQDEQAPTLGPDLSIRDLIEEGRR